MRYYWRMWLFVDESWGPDSFLPRFGVLLGVLLRHDQLNRLERFLFSVRKKYYGVEHARDLSRDLKGKDLLSNSVLRRRFPGAALPNNLCIVKELLCLPVQHPDFYLRVFASTVFSSGPKAPGLLSPDPRKLAEPFRRLVENVSQAAKDCDDKRSVTLVFDQRLGAQADIAIAVKNFVAGMKLPNIHPYPYFAVSNVSPGVQVADIFAHLLSKRVQGKQLLMPLYRDLAALQWKSHASPTRYGFVRFDERKTDSGLAYTVRRKWV